MTQRVGLGRWLLFWTIALGGAALDLATKSMIFARVGEPPAPPASIIRGILEFQTSLNPGALWGFGRTLPYSSQIFAGLSIVAGIAICYWLFVRGAAASLALTIALGLIMAGAWATVTIAWSTGTSATSFISMSIPSASTVRSSTSLTTCSSSVR